MVKRVTGWTGFWPVSVMETIPAFLQHKEWDSGQVKLNRWLSRSKVFLQICLRLSPKDITVFTSSCVRIGNETTILNHLRNNVLVFLLKAKLYLTKTVRN